MWNVWYSLTGKCAAFSEAERIADRNCARYRAAILDYIRKRKSGEVKSDLADGSDVMTQMFKASDVYTEEDIIDEVADFLTAGTQTTQYSIQSVLSHLCTRPDILAKMRAEFDECV